jgi:hypothetical protein
MKMSTTLIDESRLVITPHDVSRANQPFVLELPPLHAPIIKLQELLT